MKLILIRWLAFAGKSLLWSLLLYSAVLAILDWNDITSAFSAQQGMSLVQTESLPYKTSGDDTADSIKKNISADNSTGIILAIIKSLNRGI